MTEQLSDDDVAGEGGVSEGVALQPLRAPAPVGQHSLGRPAPAPPPSQPLLLPAQRISIYDDVQWEEFVVEWATTLPYRQVMRSGGANDHGVDVAGFLDDSGFEGEWDCYQCKHYSRALLPSDAYPEILKIVLGALAGYYAWPRRYRFVAPKGYGTTLANLLHSASRLKRGLRQEITKERSALAKQLGEHSCDEVLAFIAEADFTVFGTIELHELVEQHSRTRWHTARFGVPLPARPAPPSPSVDPSAHEQRYLAELLAAYAERHGQSFTHRQAMDHQQVSAHYLRHRAAFYSAEALRVFARDSVPEGTFGALQQEIFDGVVDVHDQEHRDGLQRLHEVATAARQLSLTANGLLPVVEVRDRTGICHQLANEHRLRWRHAAAQ
ncbi:hypothetical protein GCM10027586_02140 [Kineococcus gypseus]|uniref:ABC-three component system protein n=1 Tax=Kineococcus gypseus TaxID=1637102 RepID=UPI003D7D387F